MKKEARERLVTNEKKDEEAGLWDLIKSFFSTISLKTKFIIGIILSGVSFIAFHMFQRKWNDKEILKLELEKVKAEIEIEMAQKDIDVNNEKLENLQVKADKIVKEIAALEEVETDPERDVSKKELDDFFDKRGF